MSSPAATMESTGLFMLRKDSERRATLHRILTNFIGDVVSNIQDSVPQVCKKSHLNATIYCGNPLTNTDSYINIRFLQVLQ